MKNSLRKVWGGESLECREAAGAVLWLEKEDCVYRIMGDMEEAVGPQIKLKYLAFTGNREPFPCLQEKSGQNKDIKGNSC